MRWPVSRLDELADSCLGKMLDKQKNRGTLRPYLRNVNVRWGSFDLADVQEMRFEHDEAERYSVRPGDLVVCEGGEPGRCAVWTKPEPFLIQKALHRVRCGPRLASTFLAYWLRNLAESGRLAERFTGTTIHHLPGVALAALDVPHPPVEEQHRIVAAIETHFSRLDAAVASLKRAKANVKRARAGVLQAAVEGRLVPTEAALARAEGRDYEPASALLVRILVERKAAWAASGERGKYKEPVAPTSQPGEELPEGWCWTSISQLCAVGTGATPNRSEPRYWTNGTVPWVTSAVVNKRFVDKPSELVTTAALAETNLTIYPAGTLLVAMYGEGKTRGKCSLTRLATATNQALAALVTTSLPGTVVEWLRAFMDHNYVQLRRESAGGVQPNLNLATLQSIRLPLPPLPEQHRIVAEVDHRLSVLDALDASLDANLARCARLRQAILRRAFEGRLVPPDRP